MCLEVIKFCLRIYELWRLNEKISVALLKVYFVQVYLNSNSKY